MCNILPALRKCILWVLIFREKNVFAIKKKLKSVLTIGKKDSGNNNATNYEHIINTRKKITDRFYLLF